MQLDKQSGWYLLVSGSLKSALIAMQTQASQINGYTRQAIEAIEGAKALIKEYNKIQQINDIDALLDFKIQGTPVSQITPEHVLGLQAFRRQENQKALTQLQLIFLHPVMNQWIKDVENSSTERPLKHIDYQEPADIEPKSLQQEVQQLIAVRTLIERLDPLAQSMGQIKRKALGM